MAYSRDEPTIRDVKVLLGRLEKARNVCGGCIKRESMREPIRDKERVKRVAKRVSRIYICNRAYLAYDTLYIDRTPTGAPTKAIDPIDYKIQQGITCFRMICKCCGERLLDHEPYCVNCGNQNRQIKEAKDQGATGGVDVQLRTKRINDNAVESHVSHNERSQKKHARVFFSFNPTSDDELALKVGDIVELVKQVCDAWWMAELNGKRGLIPANYVNVIEEGETAGANAADKQADDFADDLSDLEDGSDFIENEDLVTEKEFEDYQKVLNQCGYIELMTGLDKINTAWKDIKIKIAVTGKSGSGKSTLINALLNLKDDDEGAAKTGCVETTSEPTPYPHPNNRNLELWDLPGVGTPNFPQSTYLKQVNFQQYDFIILVSSKRYTTNDTWLAKQIVEQYPGANLFFVRTQVDSDLYNMKQGKRRGLTKEEEIKTIDNIKDENLKNLQKANIENPRIFLVNSHDVNVFDFGKLSSMLIDKVKLEKRAALVLSLSVVSNEVVNEKIEQLKHRIGHTSKCAAMAAINSNRVQNERLEIDILRKEVKFYKYQLGIDSNSLTILSSRLNIDIEDLYLKMNSQSHAILQGFEFFYSRYDKIGSKRGSIIPFIRTRKYQRQCGRVLKSMLDICIKENQSLQTNLAIMSQEEYD
ncbi:hypothetical protein DPMN_052206 [Dreissena polymorpha]|uniref:Uncharacterized protein n=1 Tax=Dreissena polymorpha TaxID=45954 RepID=A0A9D4CKK3_DREPO|nr:hypothetical protein DPMN_052206 [Dreissena polymorpha]